MKDTIYRQDAIDALNVCVTIGRGNGKSVAFKIANDYADFVKKRIEALPSAQPQRWIPCSERLPDKEGNYLMTAQPTYNHAKDIRIAHWSGRWVGYVKSEIIAWMPLPAPYAERRIDE